MRSKPFAPPLSPVTPAKAGPNQRFLTESQRMTAFLRIYLAALLACAAAHAAAQSYPAKAVHVVVPFPPSSAADP